MSHKTLIRTVMLTALAILLACATLFAAVPHGWLLEGSKPADYEVVVDRNADYRHFSSAVLRSKQPKADGFATLMQQFRADAYQGKRLRLTASLKAENVHHSAGLWMRVDKDKLILAFDNMHDRPITGTRNWQEYQIVLDVSPEATVISFGVLLSGSGAVWVSHPKFDTVPSYVPVTAPAVWPIELRQASKGVLPPAAINLDLED